MTWTVQLRGRGRRAAGFGNKDPEMSAPSYKCRRFGTVLWGSRPWQLDLLKEQEKAREEKSNHDRHTSRYGQPAAIERVDGGGRLDHRAAADEAAVGADGASCFLAVNYLRVFKNFVSVASAQAPPRHAHHRPLQFFVLPFGSRLLHRGGGRATTQNNTPQRDARDATRSQGTSR